MILFSLAKDVDHLAYLLRLESSLIFPQYIGNQKIDSIHMYKYCVAWTSFFTHLEYLTNSVNPDQLA